MIYDLDINISFINGSFKTSEIYHCAEVEKTTELLHVQKYPDRSGTWPNNGLSKKLADSLHELTRLEVKENIGFLIRIRVLVLSDGIQMD